MAARPWLRFCTAAASASVCALLACALLVCALLLPCRYLCAQGSAPAAQAASSEDQNSYHLSTSSRIVLTDVTVIDGNGERVSGLQASDFTLTDDGHPEKLASFTEHRQELSGPVSDRSSSIPGAFTNALSLHPPPVLNVVLVDITNLEVVEQLYLNYQLSKFIKALPAGEPIALYWCRGPNAVLLQDFTSDRDNLVTALHKALPRFPPTGREYYSSANTLHQLAVRLAQVPGHKNILWFSGGSVTPMAPFGSFTGISAAEDAALHVVYDELERERIAVYPFDARGLVTSSDTSMMIQHSLMREIAENTGGYAFVNTNGLQVDASKLVSSDGAYYTLTYAPADFKADAKWHKVRVSLASRDRSLHLSYRQGYFADPTPASAHTSGPAPLPRTASGAPINTLPDQQLAPIVFQVEPLPVGAQTSALQPASIVLRLSPKEQQKHGTELYTLRYSLPLSAFTLQATASKTTTAVGVAVLAFNSYGSLSSRRAERLTVTLNPNALPAKPNATIVVDQQVLLPRGDTTLFCAVWDFATRRLGTLQIPLEVHR